MLFTNGMANMRGVGWLPWITMALLAMPVAPVDAQPRCFFLECAAGDTTTPAAPRPISQLPPVVPAPRAPIPRPSVAGETCQVVTGGHTYCVSSVLAPQFGFTYNPVNLTDGRLDTAWVEGKAGDGIGEWIVMIPAAGKRLRGFELLNGYHKNNDLFQKNGRVKDFEVVLPNGKPQTITLADQSGPQRFTFGSALTVEWVQLRIQSVYSGTKYKDTAITELRLLVE